MRTNRKAERHWWMKWLTPKYCAKGSPKPNPPSPEPYGVQNIVVEVANLERLVNAENFVGDIESPRPIHTASRAARSPAPQPQRQLSTQQDFSSITGFEVVGYGACEGDALYRKMSALTIGAVESDIVSVATECANIALNQLS